MLANHGQLGLEEVLNHLLFINCLLLFTYKTWKLIKKTKIFKKQKLYQKKIHSACKTNFIIN